MSALGPDGHVGEPGTAATVTPAASTGSSEGSHGDTPNPSEGDGVDGIDPADDAGAWAAAAIAAVGASASLDVLHDMELALLGKRSSLARARQALAGRPPDDRRRIGQELQGARAAVEAAVAERRGAMQAAARRLRIETERMDLTEVVAAAGAAALGATGSVAEAPRPGPAVPRFGRAHLVQRTRDALEDVFVGMGFTVADGPEVETDWYNFEALNMPPAHPARGMFDTFYLDLDPAEAVLLRTHTSPVQVRLLQSKTVPVYAVMPGRCYRRETPDSRHLPVFHQVEGLVVDEAVTFGDLAGTIETFTAAYFGPDISARLRPAFFPFTEPSAEFEITCTICRGDGCRTCSGTGWVELGGCGMIDPAVLQAVGIDPERYGGFAFGFGIDRCAQMHHGIADMRILLDNDVRVLRQA